MNDAERLACAQWDRRQRGEDFEQEIRSSWALIPNCWRMKIAAVGGTRPADEIILLEDANVLAEQKRTAGAIFKLNMLRENQVTGLVDFDQVIGRSYGLVFISFLNEDLGRDETYAVRLITALKYMKSKNRVSIPLADLQQGKLNCMEIPRVAGAEKRTYDLKGVVKYCRSL